MSPALTAMLLELGVGDHLVGRSSFCRVPGDDLPVVGDLLEVNWESLVRTNPSHVIVQASPDLLRGDVVHVAQSRGWTLLAYPLADASDITLAMESLPRDLDLRGDDHASASASAAAFNSRLEEEMSIREPAISGNRVLLLTPGPQMLGWGSETYLGDMVEALGAVNVLSFEGWRPMAPEQIVRTDVDCIVLASSLPVDPPQWLMDHLESMEEGPRIEYLVHDGLLLPSTHLPELAAAMRDILSGRKGEGS